MFTYVALEEGVLRTLIVSDDDIEISSRRWHESIGPAIGLLRLLGGGGVCVIHQPSDLLPP